MADLRCIGIALGALALCACSKTPEPEPTSSPKAAPTHEPAASAPLDTASAAPSTHGPSEVTWEAPPAWTKVDNASPMRKATYRVPKAAGDTEDAELTVSQAGGTVEMNIKRWAGQFQHRTDTKRTQRAIGTLTVDVVELSGTFAGGGMPGMDPGAPKPGWSMLAAIVETSPAGTFFKLTGPSATVAAARGDFDKLLGSLKPK